MAVTGATGFIGRHLVAELIQSGCTVRALTRSLQTAPGVEWITGTLADADSLAKLVAGAHAVVHLAGAVRGATQAAFDAVNVEGTRALGRAAAGAGIGRVLLVSSLAAREPGLSFYAQSKRSGEDALRAIVPEATILRPPAVYGAGDKELLPLLDLMRRGIGIHPGHSGRFSLIHVDDLSAALCSWVAAGVRTGIFEVHDGMATGYGWRDVLDAVAKWRGGRVTDLPVPRAVLAAVAAANLGIARVLRLEPMLTPGKVRELFHPDWVCRDGRFQTLTGWRPGVDLDEGLRRTFSP